MNTKEPFTILVGIDFSQSSPILLRHAIHSAAARGGAVLAVHVLDQSYHEFRKLSALDYPSKERLEREAKEKFAKLLEDEKVDGEVEFLVESGKPADQLNELAKNRKVSLMLVSANDMTKKRLGSVAARCVRTAPCDVLILRDWHGGEFEKLVVCTDFSKTSQRVMDRAIAVAKEYDVMMEIVNVMYPPNRDSWGEVLEQSSDSAISYEEACTARVEQNMEAFIKSHEAELEGVRYESVILTSQVPSVAITERVRAGGADLVVLGTRSSQGIASYFIGTNAERLIHDAEVSVLAVR